MRLSEMFNLTGRVAVITGGSRGLGLQIAEALGEFGAEIVLISRKMADLDAAKDGLAAAGVKVQAIAANLADHGGMAALAADIGARFGRIDILVNNAGTTWGAPAEDHPLDAWNKVIDLNVTSLFLLSQALARGFFLPQRMGSIINVASVEGLQAHHPALPGTIAYNTAKGAVVNLTRALAAVWGPKGVRVNAIAPGYFPSRMTAGTLAQWEVRLIDNTPLGKLGGSDELKGVALLLASDAGSHITGQTIVVDGGAAII